MTKSARGPAVDRLSYMRKSVELLFDVEGSAELSLDAEIYYLPAD